MEEGGGGYTVTNVTGDSLRSCKSTLEGVLQNILTLVMIAASFSILCERSLNYSYVQNTTLLEIYTRALFSSFLLQTDCIIVQAYTV